MTQTKSEELADIESKMIFDLVNKVINKTTLYNTYKEYDIKYNVNYNVAYQYLVNFSKSKELPIHRWIYYQEGFSPILVKNILEYLDLEKNIHLFDPFAGSGTSLVAANELGIKSTGFEINPFSYHIAVSKTQDVTQSDLKKLSAFSIPIYEKIENVSKKYELSIIDKLFDIETLTKIELIKRAINSEFEPIVRNILTTALLCVLQEISFYKKGGNGLKKKRVFKRVDAFEIFQLKLKEIINDIDTKINKSQATIYNCDCLKLREYNIEPIDISIFSPPYANCFDYYEVYKTELWIGEFVRSYKELKTLRKAALTSNLSGDFSQNFSLIETSELFIPLFLHLKNATLWDKKIPYMLNCYFKEMEQLINLLYINTKVGGYCVIVIGNSSYDGIAIPTDLILSEIGEKIGFKVKEIIMARKNETSSQQYKSIGNLIEFIRESIIIFKK